MLMFNDSIDKGAYCRDVSCDNTDTEFGSRAFASWGDCP